MAALKLFRARRPVFRGHLSLDNCEELVKTLIETPTIHPKVSFALLKAHRSSSAWEAGQQHTASPTRVPVAASRIALVHTMATTYARAGHLRPRLAYRYVMHCYKYLHSRGAPLQPLMSRALTLAGVTRPLQDGEWVSTVKLRFVLDKVRALEGAEAAQRLDELVFVWRGEVVAEGQARTARGGSKPAPGMVRKSRAEGKGRGKGKAAMAVHGGGDDDRHGEWLANHAQRWCSWLARGDE
ncbi:MAG: hypothetical protein M1832_002377 [Thelocarpon impressellum]|nr:MAG: hypothetical protein M1832_002377 [Thelocarpon impressellum]